MKKSPCYFQYLVLLYFLTGLAETIIVFAVSSGTADTSALIKALSVSFFISVGLLFFYSRFQNFGAALISVMGLLIVMGLFKSPVLFGAMTCLFTVWFLVNKKTCTRSAVPSSVSLKVKVVVGLSIFALLFGLIAIAGTRYIDFNGSKLIFSGQVNIDSLIHITVAAMIRDYGIISTGLHGTPFLYYHAFSHFLFGCISSITDLSLLRVYGNVHAIVIIPLLFLAIVACAEDFTSSINRKELFVRIGFVWLALFGFGCLDPKSIFNRYGLWDSYFISESYTMSLILLLAMISSLRIQSSRIRWSFVFLLLVCMSLAKSSVGILGGIFLFVHLVFFERERFLYRFIFFSFTACILFVLLSPFYFQQNATLGGGGHFISVGFNHWFSFARTYGAVSGAWPELQFCISLMSFVIIHFIYTWLFLGLAVLIGWFCKNKSHVGNLGITLNIIALLYGLIVLWKLQLYGGAEYYFSNISMFVALPFIALILGQNSSIVFKEGFIKANWCGALLVMAAGFSGGIVYAQPLLIDMGIYRIKNEAEKKQLDNGLSGYITQLIAIQNDASTKHYLVYIAKAETVFWNALPNCIANPLLITSVSERPAIYGLPDPVQCQTNNTAGYFIYEKKVFNIASATNIPHNLLAAEARKLGFKGYINVTAKSWTKRSLDN